MTAARKLHDMVASVAPVVSVREDGNTFSLQLDDTASEAQAAAAQAILASFDRNSPTAADVNVERERRLKTFTFSGHVFDFCDGRGSDLNIMGAGTLALAAIISGAAEGDLQWSSPTVPFCWTTHTNELVEMDAKTCLAFSKTAAEWKAAHIYAARRLKDTRPIASDFKADRWWKP
jgi:hypothetical protein